jgi:hypothetical protein
MLVGEGFLAERRANVAGDAKEQREVGRPGEKSLKLIDAIANVEKAKGKPDQSLGNRMSATAVIWSFTWGSDYADGNSGSWPPPRVGRITVRFR